MFYSSPQSRKSATTDKYIRNYKYTINICNVHENKSENYFKNRFKLDINEP